MLFEDHELVSLFSHFAMLYGKTMALVLHVSCTSWGGGRRLQEDGMCGLTNAQCKSYRVSIDDSFVLNLYTDSRGNTELPDTELAIMITGKLLTLTTYGSNTHIIIQYAKSTYRVLAISQLLHDKRFASATNTPVTNERQT